MQSGTCFREYGNKTEVCQQVPGVIWLTVSLCILDFIYLLLNLYDNIVSYQVLYFKNFLPCTISQSSMKALQSIDWKTYGLNLGDIVEQDGVTLIEWENLPTDTHIDIVLHAYHKQYPARDRSFLFLSDS